MPRRFLRWALSLLFPSRLALVAALRRALPHRRMLCLLLWCVDLLLAFVVLYLSVCVSDSLGCKKDACRRKTKPHRRQNKNIFPKLEPRLGERLEKKQMVGGVVGLVGSNRDSISGWISTTDLSLPIPCCYGYYTLIGTHCHLPFVLCRQNIHKLIEACNRLSNIRKDLDLRRHERTEFSTESLTKVHVTLSKRHHQF